MHSLSARSDVCAVFSLWVKIFLFCVRNMEVNMWILLAIYELLITWCHWLQFTSDGGHRVVVGSLDLSQCLRLADEIIGIKPQVFRLYRCLLFHFISESNCILHTRIFFIVSLLSRNVVNIVSLHNIKSSVVRQVSSDVQNLFKVT